MFIFGAETPADLDAISKWLDIAGNKLDYRRYGEVLTTADISVFLSTLILLQALLEILIAGGLLAPGGSIQQDGDKGPVSTSACIFQVPIPVFVKLLALEIVFAPRNRRTLMTWQESSSGTTSLLSSCGGTSTLRRCYPRR